MCRGLLLGRNASQRENLRHHWFDLPGVDQRQRSLPGLPHPDGRDTRSVNLMFLELDRVRTQPTT
jgi:hypothetical protein